MFAPDGTDTVEPATMKCGAQAPCINLPGRKSSNRGMLNRCLDFVAGLGPPKKGRAVRNVALGMWLQLLFQGSLFHCPTCGVSGFAIRIRQGDGD